MRRKYEQKRINIYIKKKTWLGKEKGSMYKGDDNIFPHKGE